MTHRLYYTDAYLEAFTATVIAVDQDTRSVYLDRSAFYPTSGGQPHDLGTLGAASVVNVIDENDRVAHVLASVETITVGQSIEGRVDWPRRFDFMQQHTGQHLLSALCGDDFGWPTLSVHFGADYCTVDVAAPQIDATALRGIEQHANAIITQNRKVSVSFEEAGAAQGLRKPSDRAGQLRIIAIEGIDRSGCGGTHVRRLGEIGSMLVRRVEKMKGATRIEFVCGARSVARARADADLLARAARTLSAAPEELPALVESQLQRVGELERERKRLVVDLARCEALALWKDAPVDANGIRRLRIILNNKPVRDAEPLAQALSALGTCIVLVLGDTPPGIMLAAAADSGLDAGSVLKSALAAVGGRGGGSPRMAQGSVPHTEALRSVAESLGF